MSYYPISGNQNFTRINNSVISSTINTQDDCKPASPLKQICGSVCPTVPGQYTVVDASGCPIQLPLGATIASTLVGACPAGSLEAAAVPPSTVDPKQVYLQFFLFDCCDGTQTCEFPVTDPVNANDVNSNYLTTPSVIAPGATGLTGCTGSTDAKFIIPKTGITSSQQCVFAHTELVNYSGTISICINYYETVPCVTCKKCDPCNSCCKPCCPPVKNKCGCLGSKCKTDPCGSSKCCKSCPDPCKAKGCSPCGGLCQPQTPVGCGCNGHDAYSNVLFY